MAVSVRSGHTYLNAYHDLVAEEKPDGEDLWSDVASSDILSFQFQGKAYIDQLWQSIEKTKTLSAVMCTVKSLTSNGQPPIKVMWMTQDFRFMGGSLGSAEGEKLTRGFIYAIEHRLPVVVEARSGGARMQEGCTSLMQMAKVSCAVGAHQRAGLPYVTICRDPCFGGVSASYAMQGDVRIGVANNRLGFSGPAVILNTQFAMDQKAYDRTCPQGFQTCEYAKQYGQIDIVLPECAGSASDNEEFKDVLCKIFRVLGGFGLTHAPAAAEDEEEVAAAAADSSGKRDYRVARELDRFDCDDILRVVFDDYVEMGGDGKVGLDNCLRGGLALLRQPGKPPCRCVVIKCAKGHTMKERAAHQHAMPTPAGYRTALRLFDLAETKGLPVFTLVDVVGALPSFDAETTGQSEAIATNLLRIAHLRVPMITLLVSEGGSGGALAIGMGNVVGMMAKSYYSVITPEGAASILGRYTDEDQKKVQFPLDCDELAEAQKIFAPQCKELGITDHVVQEFDGETCESFPRTAASIRKFFTSSLQGLAGLSGDGLIDHRAKRYAALGRWDETPPAKALERLSSDEHKQRMEKMGGGGRERKAAPAADENIDGMLAYLGDQTIRSDNSLLKGKGPNLSQKTVSIIKPPGEFSPPSRAENAKTVLDRDGPEAMAAWVRARREVLLTDTTMRDAHQSLLATRVRTRDFLQCADEVRDILHPLFSLENWGGATFDVAFRFLHEDPWERLRALRAKIPNICFQMLLRGANAVGYTSYPDNVVVEFVKLACENGMDIFRIFDCFNDVEQMRVAIDAVRKYGKVAEVAICFTGDFLSADEKIYTLDYYKGMAEKVVAAGAHMIAIKDMAGLLKPLHAKPLVDIIRSVTDLPIHFHTHNTSSSQLATLHAMTDAGCDIVDACMASMADTTSQPSLNAFVATMESHTRAPLGLDYRKLEPLDNYWLRVRELYSIFESGMLSGSANVYHHQIPGGQYSNLYMQCKSLGIMDRWEECLDMYASVNKFCGDVVKVTPSSKVVGDIALLLIRTNTSPEALEDEEKLKSIVWPASAVDMAEGGLGTPHHGFPKIMLDAILKGKPRLPGRPGETLPSTDMAAARSDLAAELGREISDVDAISAVLYPDVWRGYAKHAKKYGAFVPDIPTPAFLYGMEVGETIHVSGKKVSLDRVGPLDLENKRVLHWTVDGAKRQTTVQDLGDGVKEYKGPMANTKKPNQELGSPVGGVVFKLMATPGQAVAEGDTLAVISAMKMEVSVKAPKSGTIADVVVKKDDEVVEGALLVKLH